MLTVSSVWFDGLLLSFWWPFVRIMALFASEPFLSNRAVPRPIKVLFGLALTLVVAPLLPPMPEVELFSATGILVTLNQMLIGLAMGFAMRLVFSAMEMAGHLAGLQMGLGFASFFDPQNAQQLPILALATSLIAMLLYLAFDGHLVMITALIDSFRLLPVTTEPLVGKGFGELFRLGGTIFTYGLWLCMPIIAVLLVTNLSIGVMARAAPQFNLFAVGFPITLALGLLAFYLTMPQLAFQFYGLVEKAVASGKSVVELFAGGGR